MIKNQIEYSDFEKLELRVGKVISAESIAKSEKLLKLMVNFGNDQPTQILSGIAKWYKPEDLVNHHYIFVVNLAPRAMMGEMSNGMILGTDVNEAAVIIEVSCEISPGSLIK